MGRKIICDRCGSEIGNKSVYIENILNAKFPIIVVNMSVKESYLSEINELDLCDDCKTDLLKWIRYGKETTNGEV